MKLPILFEGFTDDSLMVRREKMDKENHEAQIKEMLAIPSVRFVNIRNAEGGCFIARIERAVD